MKMRTKKRIPFRGKASMDEKRILCKSVSKEQKVELKLRLKQIVRLRPLAGFILCVQS